MAVIVGLSLNAQDEKVRMRSAEWLHEETGRQIAEQERLEGARVVPAANSPEAILKKLKGAISEGFARGGTGTGAARGGGGAGRGVDDERNKPARPVRLFCCPEYRDPRALVEHGIAAMMRISQCDDRAIALKASQWLIEYGEGLIKGKRQPKEEDSSTVSPSGSPQMRVC